MKAAIVGSRTFCDYKSLEQYINNICKEEGYTLDEIVSGGANGADTLGEVYAKRHNLKLTVFKPDWKTYGKSAGFRRNGDIIRNCDVCFAFWDGKSHGTKNDIDLCTTYNKPCHIYEFKNIAMVTIKSDNDWDEFGPYTVPMPLEESGDYLYEKIDRCAGGVITMDIEQI